MPLPCILNVQVNWFPRLGRVYGDTFKYENNRAILFDLNEKVPTKELKECIKLALKYHSVKNIPKLGL